MHCHRAARQAFAKVSPGAALVGADLLGLLALSLLLPQAGRYALRERFQDGWRCASALAGIEKVGRDRN